MTGRILGKGHFARVQEANHIHLNVKVAVKILTFRDVKDEYVIKNMRREAKILAKVSHPNIVFLFETITTSKRYYIITELVDGGDLCTFITSQSTGKLNENQTRPLARQIISAVAHLHERGIVHRDLKMENILLDRTKENVKLVDFGLSNYRRGVELLHTHCGSPEYAAPELYISGRQYGPEVDIWSLGVIFYGMLVGKLPFQSWHKPGLNPEAKRKQLIRETKIGLTNRHQKNLVDVSLLFRNLIVRMLCPKPEDRITMLNLQSHAWIYGRFYREYPQVDGNWKRLVLTRIAKMCSMPAADVCRTIEMKRYSSLGGIFNIAKFFELKRRIEADNNSRDKVFQINENVLIDLAKPAIRKKGPSFAKNEEVNEKLMNSTKYNQQKIPILYCRNPMESNKPPFTVSTAKKLSQQGFAKSLGAAFNKILNHHKDTTKGLPSNDRKKMQNNEFENHPRKFIGIPRHTAARAAARTKTLIAT